MKEKKKYMKIYLKSEKQKIVSLQKIVSKPVDNNINLQSHVFVVVVVTHHTNIICMFGCFALKLVSYSVVFVLFNP